MLYMFFGCICRSVKEWHQYIAQSYFLAAFVMLVSDKQHVSRGEKKSKADEGCHVSLQIFVQIMKANSAIWDCGCEGEMRQCVF
jgi:hypothetical protein